jgi:hypothetical protein
MQYFLYTFDWDLEGARRFISSVLHIRGECAFL